MTVIYLPELETSKFCCSLKLLTRWRGSFYSVIWKELLAWLGLYYFISFTYRFGLTEMQKRKFEIGSNYCRGITSRIPMSFILGFYVSNVIARWNLLYAMISWPNRSNVLLTTYLHGMDERALIMRRTVSRYMAAAFILMFRSLSAPVKKRWPTLSSITDSGLLTPNEQMIMESIKTQYNLYLIPTVWAAKVVIRARLERRIDDDNCICVIFIKMRDAWEPFIKSFLYDTIGIPLVYTQFVTLAVYMYFLLILFGSQFLENETDIYVPVTAVIQFLFYFGWLRVAHTLLNPFGEKEDDFDTLIYCLRHAVFLFFMNDYLHRHHPKLMDFDYSSTNTDPLPAEYLAQIDRPHFYRDPYIETGSAAHVQVPLTQWKLRIYPWTVRKKQSILMYTAFDHKQESILDFLERTRERSGDTEAVPGRRRSSGAAFMHPVVSNVIALSPHLVIDELKTTPFDNRFKEPVSGAGAGIVAEEANSETSLITTIRRKIHSTKSIKRKHVTKKLKGGTSRRN